jgi:Tfp pilus assembly protein PilP
MTYLGAMVLLFLLSGCSDSIADSDGMSDLKKYVEQTKSRRPVIEPEIHANYLRFYYPQFSPDKNPFDSARMSSDGPNGMGCTFSVDGLIVPYTDILGLDTTERSPNPARSP